MKFKVKNLEISTGDALVVILNEDDANKYDLHRLDRISVKNGKDKKITAVLDLTNSKKLVPCGSIGLFDEVKKAISSKNTHNIEIFLEKKPESVALIKKKLDRKSLDYNEFKKIMMDIKENNLTTFDVRYLIALTNPETDIVEGIILAPGKKLGEIFTYVSDMSYKCQRSIPMSFFNSLNGQCVFNP